MNDLTIARRDDEPEVLAGFFGDADRVYMAAKRFHQDGEVLDAVAIWLCSDRSPEDTEKMTKRLEAIGESLQKEYDEERGPW